MIKYQNLESILNNYKMIKARIRILEIELNNSELDGIQAIDYSRDKLCNSYKVSSIVENLAFKGNKEKEIIQSELKYLRNIKEEADEALMILNERDRDIIKLRYIEKVPNVLIARQFRLSESSVMYIRKQAISKISKLFA